MPGQEFNLLIDTGSSDTWVVNKFDASQSISFLPTFQQFHVGYADRSQYEGSVGMDLFRVTWLFNAKMFWISSALQTIWRHWPCQTPFLVLPLPQILGKMQASMASLEWASPSCRKLEWSLQFSMHSSNIYCHSTYSQFIWRQLMGTLLEYDMIYRIVHWLHWHRTLSTCARMDSTGF